jgi:hypothetical protein
VELAGWPTRHTTFCPRPKMDGNPFSNFQTFL